jgi:hypothetical protein
MQGSGTACAPGLRFARLRRAKLHPGYGANASRRRRIAGWWRRS